MQAWVKEMAAFAKQLAPKQILGVGDEGFATSLNSQDSAELVSSNPGNLGLGVLNLMPSL